MMTVRNTTKWAVAMSLGLSLAACGGGGADGVVDTTPDTLSTQTSGDALVKVGNKLFSVPSPLQTAMLIRKLGLPYESNLPLSTDSLTKFTSKAKKAMALGVYGADLAYVTIHKDGQRSLRTLKAIEQLSVELNLSHAFDKGLLEGFKANINNEDSLLRFTGRAFRAADMYLKNDQQNDVSAAVIAGGWVEGLYLTLGSGEGAVDKEVAKRLAEQRHTLTNLIALLQQSGGDPQLIAELQDLATAYSGVEVRYTFSKPTLDAANKTTYINSVTSADISPETLQTIIRKVRAIRSSIIA